MKAKHTLLTHFSQRYCKTVKFEDGENVGYAYDMMRIEMDSFWKLRGFVPHINELFGLKNTNDQPKYFEKEIGSSKKRRLLDTSNNLLN